MARRFPFPHPFGWFQVAYPDDLEPGTATALRYWSTDLVLWRDEVGEYHLQDAYCPHLGAHLGVGGRVCGTTLECPFHGWAFSGDGDCVKIPYSDRVNRKARLRTYPLIVRNGMVMAWRHPDPHETPRWDIPDIPEVSDDGWSDYYRSTYTIRTVPQEMAENGVDPAHFLFVHGTETVAEMETYETDGPNSVMLSKQSYVTPRGTTWGRIDVFNHGPGFAKVWFSGIVDAINIAATTPIDEETTQVRFNFTVRKFEDESMTSTVADAFVAEINKQIIEDTPIWENKIFLLVPALSDGDGPIAKFRKWYAQFYAEPMLTDAQQ